jgi:hypothetical protein
MLRLFSRKGGKYGVEAVLRWYSTCSAFTLQTNIDTSSLRYALISYMKIPVPLCVAGLYNLISVANYSRKVR